MVKAVLKRIISIVRVPSLLLNKGTHHNHDDELFRIPRSVKIESTVLYYMVSSLMNVLGCLCDDRVEVCVG